MSAFIDSNDRLQIEPAAGLALTCPQCLVYSHITPQAVPRFDELTASRPTQIGLVFRCDSCNAPVFLRFGVRSYGERRIELSSQYSELERPKEKFSYNYLATEVEPLFREALSCYSHGEFNAFATMCRRTMQAVFAHRGESGRLRIFDELNELRDIAEIDAASFVLVRRVIFGNDSDPPPGLPLLDEDQTALLLEVIKDLLHQCYVRQGRLREAMTVRRFLSDQSERHGVPGTPGAPGTPAASGAIRL